MNQIIQWIKKRKVLSILVCIFLFLIFTNPSQTAFKNYLGYTSYDGLKKEKNFFIFSVYRDNSKHKEKKLKAKSIYDTDYEMDYEISIKMDNKYFAVAGNFFQLKKPKIETVDSIIVIDHPEAVDSVNVVPQE